MSWYSRTIFMTLGMVMWWSVSALGSVDCGPCEEPNDPSLVMGGGSPCAPLDEGAGIEGEPCKECDGKGGIRNKEGAEEIEVDGVPGRCCGGVWYAIDREKEDDECWEWERDSCKYVELPRNCWVLITKEDDIDNECDSCVLGICHGNVITKTFPYQVAVRTCYGREGWEETGAIGQIAWEYPCKSEFDALEMLDAIEMALPCLEDEGSGIAASLLDSILSIWRIYQETGHPGIALGGAGAENIASIIEAICHCIDCEPCDYVECKPYINPRYKIRKTIKRVKLAGDLCP
jgi:hypothetical protein